MVSSSLECLVAVLLTFLILVPSASAKETCNVRDQTQKQLDWWNSFSWKTPKEYSFGLREYYRPNAIFTFMDDGEVWSFPRFISSTDELTISNCRVKVLEDIVCAEGQWCHLEVQTTYGDDSGKTLSYREFWTWIYDRRSCLVQQVYVLHDKKDFNQRQTVFAKRGSDEL